MANQAGLQLALLAQLVSLGTACPAVASSWPMSYSQAGLQFALLAQLASLGTRVQRI
jgi:hypothetical protein